MSKEPLSRKQQEDMMASARARREASLKRWREDPGILEFLRANPEPIQDPES